MDLQSLLGDLPLSQFVAEYYQRLPFSQAQCAAPICELGNWQTLASLIADDTSDVLVCRRNEQRAGQRPRTLNEARQLVDVGCTLFIRHTERHDERLAAVAAAFERAFAAPVNIHLYCTPSGQFGFGWHYDAEEVFIVQATGRKEYRLRKNTVNPWPIEEKLPADMRYEREIMPMMRCELAAGDLLYIPSGYWHMGESREEAISFSIGVQPRTGVDVFDFLRTKIIDSLLWRQRLPVAGTVAAFNEQELRHEYEALFQQLAGDFQKLLHNPRLIDDFLASLRAPTQSAPQSAAAAAPADPTT
jgi:50S ribosomal protein L16 3-hydroxylase